MSDSLENAVTGRRISRRRLLRSTARLTAGLVAAGSVGGAAATPEIAETATVAPDHDAVTGEIFDRERHHHWDTV
jgi:hypothetical protein